MPDTSSKVQRWLDLVAYLASRRVPATVDEVWAAVPAYAEGLEGGPKDPESVRRTFERDKKDLRALGIDIETVTFHINSGDEESHGYRLARKDFHLPYLRLVQEAEEEKERASGVYSRPVAMEGEPSDHPWARVLADAPTDRPRGRRTVATHFELTEDEAGAALEGLGEVASIPAFPMADEARPAFRKLAFDLDPALLHPSSLVVVRDPEVVSTADTVKLLSDALLACKRVTFRYRSMERDEEEERTVRPYGLLFQHGRWYLVAWAEDRDAVRMFRVGRMSDAAANTRKPDARDYEIPPDFDLGAFAGRKAWELGAGEPTVAAFVHFRFPRSIWAERNAHGTLVRDDEDGGQLREIPVRRADPFLRWVLSLEGDARVVAPPELARAFRSMAAAVAERHAPRGGGHA